MTAATPKAFLAEPEMLIAMLPTPDLVLHGSSLGPRGSLRARFDTLDDNGWDDTTLGLRSSGDASLLRLAVDARVIAQDARGIGRYARAVLRRLMLRDDLALALLADGPFAGRAREDTSAPWAGIVSPSLRAYRSDAELVWHPANGTFFLHPLPFAALRRSTTRCRFVGIRLRIAAGEHVRSAHFSLRRVRRRIA